jgi:hypothetical protein
VGVHTKTIIVRKQTNEKVHPQKKKWTGDVDTGDEEVVSLVSFVF